LFTPVSIQLSAVSIQLMATSPPYYLSMVNELEQHGNSFRAPVQKQMAES